MRVETRNYGWAVTGSGTGINLILGALYTWSIFKSEIETELGLNAAQTALPYTVECLVFAFMMALAGRMQDKAGPRWVAAFGGLLVGAGFFISGVGSTSGNPLLYYVAGYGCLTGAGTAFAYASTTPPAVKWFPPRMHGLVIGIVVGGVGLASVWAAPLISFMLGSSAFSLASTFKTLGVAFFAAIVILAQFLRNPPEGYAPAAPGYQAEETAGGAGPAADAADYTWLEMMKTGRFYIIWIMFAFGAGAGLMLISFAKSMASGSIAEMGYMLVALLAVGNAGGRVAAGAMSDRIGRMTTLLAVYLLQAAMLAVLSLYGNHSAAVIIAVIAIGFNYGACLSVFPSITAGFFGLKNLGMNYGIVFTAWGVGSIMATVAGKIKVEYGSYTTALVLAAVLCVAAAAMTFAIRPAGPRE